MSAGDNVPSGTLTKFLIGTTELYVETVDFGGSSGTDDITHTGAGGWRVLIPTIKQGTYRAAGGYDLDANYHTTPPNINLGQALAAVHAKPNGTLDYTGAALVVTFNWRGGPKAGAVRWEGVFESTGAQTHP